jgi:RNA polymerase sigma factor (sigma-70 family)
MFMEVLEMPRIKRTLQQQQTLFEDLYESAFPPVARFVSKMGGSFEDAKDVFQDALIVFHEKHANPEFSIQVAEEAYILGIAKHLWIRKFNKERNLVSLDTTEAEINIPDDFYPAVNEVRLLQMIEQTGQKCLNLLRAFYYKKLPVKQIAKALGYTSEHSASVQKYKCIEKIRSSIKQQSISYEDLID